jgi:hypothetical protein
MLGFELLAIYKAVKTFVAYTVDVCPTDTETFVWLRVAAFALPAKRQKARAKKLDTNNFLDIFMLILKVYIYK